MCSLQPDSVKTLHVQPKRFNVSRPFMGALSEALWKRLKKSKSPGTEEFRTEVFSPNQPCLLKWFLDYGRRSAELPRYQPSLAVYWCLRSKREKGKFLNPRRIILYVWHPRLYFLLLHCSRLKYTNNMKTPIPTKGDSEQPYPRRGRYSRM